MRVTPLRLSDFNVLLGQALLPFYRSPEGDFMWLLLSDLDDPEGWLIVGDVHPHLTLLTFALLSGQDIKDFRRRLIEATAKNEEFRNQHGHRVRAGGICANDGTVTNWAAISFRKETPEELREALQKKLRETVQQFFHEEEITSGKIVLPFPPEKP